MSDLAKQFFDEVVKRDPIQEPFPDLGKWFETMKTKSNNQDTTSVIVLAIAAYGYSPFRQFLTEAERDKLNQIWEQLQNGINRTFKEQSSVGMPRLAMALTRCGALPK